MGIVEEQQTGFATILHFKIDFDRVGVPTYRVRKHRGVVEILAASGRHDATTCSRPTPATSVAKAATCRESLFSNALKVGEIRCSQCTDP